MVTENTVVGEEISKESLFDVLAKVDSQLLESALQDMREKRWQIETELDVLRAKETILLDELRGRDGWLPF